MAEIIEVKYEQSLCKTCTHLGEHKDGPCEIYGETLPLGQSVCNNYVDKRFTEAEVSYMEHDMKALIEKEEEMKMEEMIKHPKHYITGGIEAIDVIEAWTADLNGIQAFCLGNVLKYISRWQKKGGVTDLQKAKEYLDRVIANELMDRSEAAAKGE